jgi:hypothetical protein
VIQWFLTNKQSTGKRKGLVEGSDSFNDVSVVLLQVVDGLSSAARGALSHLLDVFFLEVACVLILVLLLLVLLRGLWNLLSWLVPLELVSLRLGQVLRQIHDFGFSKNDEGVLDSWDLHDIGIVDVQDNLPLKTGSQVLNLLPG